MIRDDSIDDGTHDNMITQMGASQRIYETAEFDASYNNDFIASNK